MTVAVDVLGAAKTFGDGAAAVHAFGPLDLRVEAGSFVALLGPSGCGKSTLLLMIAGLLGGSAGEIRLAGRRVAGPQTEIGIVFQSHVLVDWRDVLGNVLLQIDLRGLPRADYLARARDLLRSVGLDAFAGRRPYELSGGMQQRTAFCRALVHNPPLVLMDEPLGALDAMTREQLRADLERLWLRTGKTVLLVTHSIEEAVQLADKVVVISPRPGRIVREIDVDLPRPRDLEVCESPLFHAHVAEIKRIFASYGVI
jgi:NitT/TauT family transport system ATP-binding protein